jgi:hypothetical protein
MRKIAIFIALVLLLTLGGATPVLADGIPKLPHAFYGNVTVNSAPAPAGTRVSATVSDGEIIPTQNPVITVGGSYGVNSQYLLVQGYDIPDGATITFHVTNSNGTAIGGTTVFQAGGGPTRMDLRVNITAPPSGGGGGGGGGGGELTIVTDTFGSIGSITIDNDGIVQDTFTATSPDGNLSINIPAGTQALDKDGNPLTTIIADVLTDPPDPPADANIIGLAYSFGPAGATFDPPITFTWSYDPSALPAGIAEEDLVIAYYDATTGLWVELPCVVDTENNMITASVSHYTTFAMIGIFKPASFTISSLVISPVQVSAGEKVDISMAVANTGGLPGSYTVVLSINGVEEAEKSVTVAAGSIQTVSFSVTKTEAGSYSVTVDGLSGSFTVVALETTTPTTSEPTTAAPATPTTSEPTTAAPTSVLTPLVEEEEPTTQAYWNYIIGAAVVIMIGLIILFARRRRHD